MQTFLIMWLGQTVSAFGTGLTRFALGVWVYQLTDSVTQFALILFATALPGIALSPVVGALVDRWDRRLAMILSDFGAGLCTLVVALLASTDRLEIWHIYVILALASIFQAFQWPAFSAATTLLVPKEQFGRIAGLRQLGIGTAEISAPLVAAMLLDGIGLSGILFLDFGTFFCALGTLRLVRVPAPLRAHEPETKPGLMTEARLGWCYVRERPELFRLLGLFAAVNLSIGSMQVLLTPLVLSFSDARGLGMVMTVGSAGFLLGGVLMSTWGGPAHRMKGILTVLALQAPVLFMATLATVPALAAMMFLFLIGLSIVNGCSQALWQVKIAPEIQGRVFAIRRMIALGALPVAYLVAGPLADRVFEPTMAEGGALARVFGPLVGGVGDGRGVALMFVFMGIAIGLIAVAGAFSDPLRNLEVRLPDAIVEAMPELERASATDGEETTPF